MIDHAEFKKTVLTDETKTFLEENKEKISKLITGDVDSKVAIKKIDSF